YSTLLYITHQHLLLIVSTNTLQYLNLIFFFFNDPLTTEIYTLSLHDALPISAKPWVDCSIKSRSSKPSRRISFIIPAANIPAWRSEEHTSELQSPYDLVCRLLLEKKKKLYKYYDLILPYITHPDVLLRIYEQV